MIHINAITVPKNVEAVQQLLEFWFTGAVSLMAESREMWKMKTSTLDLPINKNL